MADESVLETRLNGAGSTHGTDDTLHSCRSDIHEGPLLDVDVLHWWVDTESCSDSKEGL